MYFNPHWSKIVIELFNWSLTNDPEQFNQDIKEKDKEKLIKRFMKKRALVDKNYLNGIPIIDLMIHDINLDDRDADRKIQVKLTQKHSEWKNHIKHSM